MVAISTGLVPSDSASQEMGRKRERESCGVQRFELAQAIFQRIDEDGSGQVTFEELKEGARKDKEFQSRCLVSWALVKCNPEFWN